VSVLQILETATGFRPGDRITPLSESWNASCSAGLALSELSTNIAGQPERTPPATTASPVARDASGKHRAIVRSHSLLVRVTHWVNVLCVTLLLMSGLQIFNAHPALYLGSKSAFDAPVLALTARNSPAGPVGETTVLGVTFETTGVLGLSTAGGQLQGRGFPSWLTIPSYQDLATGRRWHFFFAWAFVVNGLVYVVAGLLRRHVQRDLVPSTAELRGIGRSIGDHLRLRFHRGRDYNVLQKLSYLAMIFLVLPLIVLAGMAMSPGLDAAFPWLPDLFGGRQTARTVHFVAAIAIVLFVLVHVAMVLLSGVWNNLRSMLTGRYVTTERGERR
jgi:thiosulfate reductase cytochrome b subunit